MNMSRSDRYIQVLGPFILALALVVGLTGPARADLNGAQRALSAFDLRLVAAPAEQPGSPAAAAAQPDGDLAEVRSILQEASRIASAVAVPDAQNKNVRSIEVAKFKVLEFIIKAQARAGDIIGALSTNKATQWKTALGDIAVAQAKSGQVREALRTAVSIDLDTRAIQVVIDALVQAGDMQAALHAVDLIQRPNDYIRKSTVLAYLARVQTRAGDQSAAETFQRALQAANSLKDNKGKYKALMAVAKLQAEASDPAASAETFKTAVRAALAIQEEPQKAAALKDIAKAQVEGGDPAAGDQTFLQAIQVARTMEIRVGIHYLGPIAIAQKTVGNRTTAMQIFEQVMASVETLPVSEKANVLTSLAAWQVKAGESQAAVVTLQRARVSGEAIEDRIWRADRLQRIATLAAEAGAVEMALEVSEAIDKELGLWKAKAMRGIMTVLVKAKERPGAAQAIQKLAQAATTMAKGTFFPKDDKMLLDLTVVQAAGDVQAVVRTASAISQDGMQYLAYTGAAEILIEKGDWPGAQQVFAAMKEPWMMDGTVLRTIRKLSQGQAQAGDSKGALTWARQQKAPLSQANALLGVAEGIMERKGVEKLVPME